MINAYRIGVEINTQSNAAGVLGTMMQHLVGINTHAKELEGTLARVGKAAIGAAAAFAGFQTLKGLFGIAQDGDKLNHQLELLKVKFGANARVDLARAGAISTSIAVPTSTPAENVKVLGELASQVGGMAEAVKILPEVQRLAYVVSQLTGKDAGQVVQQSVKFADLTGNLFSKGPDGQERVDPAKFTAMMDVVERMTAASGGLITPNGLLQFAKQAGVPIRLMDPQRIAMMGEAMIAMGDSRAGTAETSLFQQFAGGTMKKMQAEEMQKYGLLHRGEWKVGKGGHIEISDSASRRLGALAADPAKLATMLSDEMKSRGLDREGMMIELFRLLGRATTQRLMSDLIQGKPQMDRFAANYAAAPATGVSYAELQKGDMTTNLKGLQAAWEGFLEVFGQAAMPVAIKVLGNLTDAVHWLTEETRLHPRAARYLFDLALGLGALLLVSGSLTVVRFALGPLASGISLLATSMTPFAAGGSGAVALRGLISLLPQLALAAGAAYLAYRLVDWAIHPDMKDAADQQKKFADERQARGIPTAGATTPAQARPSFADRLRMTREQARDADAAAGTANDPVHVIVKNGRDLIQGVGRGLANLMARPGTGPTGPDPRADQSLGVLGVGP